MQAAPPWRKIAFVNFLKEALVHLYFCYFAMALSVSFVHFLEEAFVELRGRIRNQLSFKRALSIEGELFNNMDLFQY